MSEASALSAQIVDFLEAMRAIRREFVQPADIVLEGAPLMETLASHASVFLQERHRQGSDGHYTRNLIYAEPDDTMSLYCIVWRPGQWSPVHDHGAWGLVGVVSGALHERAYIRVDAREKEDTGIILRRGCTCILGPGSVTTFVPDPDHIHRAGVPRERSTTLTLHLYGRNMDRYNQYDLESGTRVRVDPQRDLQAGA